MTGFRHLMCGTTVLMLLAAPAAMAQNAQDIIKKFEDQKTRGLVLAPTGAAPAAPTASAPAPAATSTAAAPRPAPTTTTVTTATYQPLAQDEQINLQIRFDFDSAALRADQKPVLEVMCQAMKSVDVAVFQIIGHTDASGSAAYNETLSLLRAQEVRRHLIEDCGISADRLQAIGMGESAPFLPNNPNDDQNRRVEFQALG